MLINEAYTLCAGFLRDLIALDTSNPPGHETAAAQYIASALESYGIPCELMSVAEGRSNVLTRPMGGSGPAVLLTGHLDVVPAGDGWSTPPFSCSERGNRIFGRGACDMKGGIAAMMTAAILAVREGRTLRPFRLGFVADEEIYGEGTRALLRASQPNDWQYVVIGEPTENAVHIAHRGAIRFRLRIHGRACHAGAPERGVNALEASAKVIEAVRLANKQASSRRHEVLPPPTLCCTMIQAGSKDNIVPDLCEVVVDCRPGVGDTAQSFESMIRSCLDSLGGLPEGAHLECETYIDVPAGSVKKNSDIVQWARECHSRAFGTEPDVASFPACCDLSQFTAAGIPAILCGPGSIAQAHTTDEFVEREQLEQAIAFYYHCLTVC